MKLLADVSIGEFKAPIAAFAPSGTGAEAGGTVLVKFVSLIIGFLTSLAGLMFLIYFITAGLSWVSSGGDKSKVEHAREQMVQAALGLIIVIASYAIAGVVGKVLGIDILNPINLLQKIGPTTTP